MKVVLRQCYPQRNDCLRIDGCLPLPIRGCIRPLLMKDMATTVRRREHVGEYHRKCGSNGKTPHYPRGSGNFGNCSITRASGAGQCRTEARGWGYFCSDLPFPARRLFRASPFFTRLAHPKGKGSRSDPLGLLPLHYKRITRRFTANGSRGRLDTLHVMRLALFEALPYLAGYCFLRCCLERTRPAGVSRDIVLQWRRMLLLR